MFRFICKLVVPVFFLLIAVCMKAQSLVITEKKGKYGLKKGDDWELKARYEKIEEVSQKCFILKNKNQYFLYHYEDFWIKGKYRPGFQLEKGFTNVIRTSDERFALANDKGLYASYKNGIKTSAFAYTDVKFQTMYVLYLDRNRKWNYFYKPSYSSTTDTLTADSLVLNDQESILLYDKTGNDSFGSMATIGYTGGLRYPIPYDANLGKQNIILEYNGAKAVMSDKLKTSEWYFAISPLENKHYRVENDKKIGIMDQALNLVIPVKYPYLVWDGDHYIAHEYHDKRGFLGFKTGSETVYFLFNENGKYLVESYSSITRFTPYSYKVGNQIFNCDTEKFEDGVFNILDANDNISLVYKDSSYYYVNPNGKRSQDFPVVLVKRYERERGGVFFGIFKMVLLVPAVADIASGKDPFGDRYAKMEKEYGRAFHSQLARVALSNEKGEVKYGFIDTSFKVVIPPMYDDAGDFFENINFVADKNGKYALINKENKKLSGHIYESYYYYAGGMSIVEIGTGFNSYFIIDQKGQRIKGIPNFWSFEFENTGEKELIIKIAGRSTDLKYRITKTGEAIRIKTD